MAPHDGRDACADAWHPRTVATVCGSDQANQVRWPLHGGAVGKGLVQDRPGTVDVFVIVEGNVGDVQSAE